MERKRYEVHRIRDINPTLISNNKNNINVLQITNTTIEYGATSGPVKVDLYIVKEPRTSTPLPDKTYYLINGLEIPAGVSVELGEKDLPFITDRDLEVDLYIVSDHPDGCLTIIVKQ